MCCALCVAAGLTFDSGGYNIKTGAGCNVEYMKYDMAGAGATFGAARALGSLEPPGVEVRSLVLGVLDANVCLHSFGDRRCGFCFFKRGGEGYCTRGRYFILHTSYFT